MNPQNTLVRYFRRIRRDAFRSFCQTQLFSESAKFSASMLGLRFPPKPMTAAEESLIKEGFVEYFQSLLETNICFSNRLQISKHYADYEHWKYRDISSVEFDTEGNLSLITFFPDITHPVLLDEHSKVRVIVTFQVLYNRIRSQKGVFCAVTFASEFKRSFSEFEPQPLIFAERIYASTFVVFQNLNGALDERQVYPRFDLAKHPGSGLLTIFCRIDRTKRFFDFWIQANHLVVDGIAIRDLLCEIQKLGVQNTISPLSIGSSLRSTQLISPDFETRTACLAIDFGELFEAKSKVEKFFLGRKYSFSSYFVWMISRHEFFRNETFSMTVDRPATRFNKRSVAAVVLDAAKYFDPQKPLDGFLDFASSYDRGVRFARRGLTRLIFAGKLIALLPLKLQSVIYRFLPLFVRRMVGTSVISMLPIDTDFFSGSFHPVFGRISIVARIFPRKKNKSMSGVTVSVRTFSEDFEDSVRAIEECFENIPRIFSLAEKSLSPRPRLSPQEISQ